MRRDGRNGTDRNIEYHFRPNMDYVTLWFMFLQLKKRLNHILKKRYWYPYMLRHSRLTVLANILTDQQLKKFAGWTPDSSMPSVYIHLSGKELDEPLLLQHGLIKNEDKTRPVLTGRLCPRCEHLNQITNKFCDKCSMVLSPEGYEEIRKKEEEQEKRLKKIEQDMHIVKQLLAKGVKFQVIDDEEFLKEHPEFRKVLMKDTDAKQSAN